MSNKLQRIKQTVVGVIITLSLVSAFATNADTHTHAPTESKGVSVNQEDSFPLGKQIPAMKGYQIRFRTISVEAGGYAPKHGHKKRPGAAFIVSGDKLTEYRNGKTIALKPGDLVLETVDTDHWVVNNGEKAIIFAVDIIPIEKPKM